MVQHPCVLLQDSLLMAEPQLEGTALTALTRSTLSQRSFRHRHLQSVTTEDEYTHIESHRAAVPWLHEECTSLHGQEKTPPWSSDTAAPVQPCPEPQGALMLQSRCFPRVTRNCPFGLNTHMHKYIKRVTIAFKVLHFLQISLKQPQICKLNYAKLLQQ